MQAIIDGRYISASWIGFNESYAPSQICELHSPGNYTTSVDRRSCSLERVCTCVRESGFTRSRVNACVHACVYVVESNFTTYRALCSTILPCAERVIINGLIKRFEFCGDRDSEIVESRSFRRAWFGFLPRLWALQRIYIPPSSTSTILLSDNYF